MWLSTLKSKKLSLRNSLPNYIAILDNLIPSRVLTIVRFVVRLKVCRKTANRLPVVRMRPVSDRSIAREPRPQAEIPLDPLKVFKLLNCQLFTVRHKGML